MFNKKEKKIKVAINGFGRIGRLFFKMALADENLEIVAINDLGDLENMTYLLNYDSAQKSLPEIIGEKAVFEKNENGENFLIVQDKKIPFFSIKNPAELPWKKLEVKVVAECTGVFNSFAKSSAHLSAGAKKVVLSGPTKDEQDLEFAEGKKGATVLMGINDNDLEKYTITSNASCTTNAAGIPLQILQNKIGIESAFLNTVHSYTATQSIVDSPVRKKDFRRGRAGAQNIVPTSTGAAIATAKIIPELTGKFDGMAIRVPTISGSLVDITFIAERETFVEEINNIFLEAEQSEKYQGLFRTESEMIVSTDIIGDTHPAIIDLNFTKVRGRLVKIVVWYDNEAGFTKAFLEQIKKIALGE